MELEEGWKGMRLGNTPVVSQIVGPVKLCSCILNSLQMWPFLALCFISSPIEKVTSSFPLQRNVVRIREALAAWI